MAADAQATCWLTVHPAGWRLPVAPGQTLLQAAQQAGVRLPRSCRNGSCRACIARLLAGRMHHTIDWPGLLPEEKAEGWILPCVACPDSDLQIDAPQATGPVGPELQAARHTPSPGGPPPGPAEQETP